MRRIILNFHLCIAIVAGLFMVIQGITGCILAFEPELDRASHRHLAYIRPEGQILSISEICASVSRHLGGEQVVAYVPSSSPNISSEVLVPSGIAYVNQYTGEVLGVRPRGQTLLGFVKALHARLGFGAVGKSILCWSAVAAFLSVISGLYLWWPIKRIRIRTKGGAKRFWFDLHNAIGICTFIPLTLLVSSGMLLGFESQAASLIYTLTRSKPTQISESPHRTANGTTLIDVDVAVSIARSRIPGTEPYRVQMPQYGGLYRIELVDPSNKITGSRNVVALNPLDGTVVSLGRASDLSRGDRILAANEAIHTGEILGLPSRVVACVTSFAISVQALSGAFIWFYRNRIFQTV